MTDVISTQIPFQATPLKNSRKKFQETYQNSGRTTRSGTPEGRDIYANYSEELGVDSPMKDRNSPRESAFEIGYCMSHNSF